MTDPVNPADHAARMADAAWERAMARHCDPVRRQLIRFDGRGVKYREDRRAHGLMGIPHEWRSYAVVRDASPASWRGPFGKR